MSLLCVALIKPNEFSMEKLTYDDINNYAFLETIKKYVEIVKIKSDNDNETMQYIISILDNKIDSVCSTYKCYESATHAAYHMYFPTTEQSANNTLGRFISENHEYIIGNSIILYTAKEKNCDITYSDVTQIIRSKVIHNAVYITHNGEITNNTYVNIPIDGTNLTTETCRCIQIEFLNKVLCVFIEKCPQYEKLNEKATILCKNLKIHGDVVVSCITSYPCMEITDIDVTTFDKILCVRSNISQKELTNISDEVIRNNFYDILEKYANKYNGEICNNIPDDVLYGRTLNSTL